MDPEKVKSRTYCCTDNAFALGKNEKNLIFHYNKFRDQLEVVNHDCMDFVFYKNENKIKVVSFIEQNDSYKLQIDQIT